MMRNRLRAAWLAVLTAAALMPGAPAADLKISQLSTATSPTTADEVPLNASGVTRKLTLGGIAQTIGFTAHAADLTIHRSINDAGISATDLFSASRILALLGGKANTSHTHAATDITSGTLGVTRGGTGLGSIAAGSMIYASAGNTLSAVTLSSALSVSGGILGVVDNTSIQKTQVAKAGSTQGTRQKLNFIDSSTLSFSVSDNAGSDRVDVTGTVLTSGLPGGYHGSAAPVYASASTLTQAAIRERDGADTTNIIKTSATTVNTASTGLNGIAQSANLTGAITVTAASAAVTFSTTQAGVLQVGDVVCTAGGQCRRLSAGSGAAWTAESAWTSTESSVTAKRGGKAPNTHYLLYAISDGTTPGLLLSTRNVAGGDTLVDLPSGYTASRQQAFAVRLDPAGNLLPFLVGDGWPDRPVVELIGLQSRYNGTSIVNGTYNVLAGGSAASYGGFL